MQADALVLQRGPGHTGVVQMQKLGQQDARVTAGFLEYAAVGGQCLPPPGPGGDDLYAFGLSGQVPVSWGSASARAWS